ncbi:hypothetical protein EDC01DRAFT_630006 [Geopyxis carbonaria]|nr:hypothetical protein EDC01DRAFT_630006 [Geopyxis carbonaria]
MATSMFRLVSRQGLVRVVPRPFFRLSNGIASRQIHSVPLPYSGPPSYDTIARRLSSDPGSHLYFTRKRQQEAKERGEYVDIHDIGGIDPEEYDVLITDVNQEIMQGEIAEVVGIPYHAEATKEAAKEVVEIGQCYIFGRKFRTIFPAVVSKGTQAHWVFFVIDGGSPLTYLSVHTSDLFGISEASGPYMFNIAGHSSPVHRSPARSHFTELNLIGMDFFNYHQVSQVNDFEKRRAQLFIGKGWQMMARKRRNNKKKTHNAPPQRQHTSQNSTEAVDRPQEAQSVLGQWSPHQAPPRRAQQQPRIEPQ